MGLWDWLFSSDKKQEPKPKKKQDNDDKWMYDFLVQFLCSPEWRVTILNFVDQNCIVFDNEEQNKFAYTEIHNQFKKLVAGLFDSVMQDIGLTEEKLVTFIAKGLQSKNKKLFEQLLIADDFLRFKSIMVRRNQQLEQEAADALSKQGRSSISSTISSPSVVKSQGPSQAELEEQRMLKQAMELSLKQQEERKRRAEEAEKREAEEKAKIEAQEMAKSRLEEDKTAELRRRKEELERKRRERLEREQRELKERQAEEARLKEEAEQKALERQRKRAEEEERRRLEDQRIRKLADLGPLKNPVKRPSLNQQPARQQESPVYEKKEQVVVEKSPEAQVPSESVEDRKKRLMEQRELLKKKKQQERQKELENKEAPKPEAPVIQRIVLDDAGIIDTPATKEEPHHEDKISQDEIERRRNLMKKIKNRVIQDI